MLNEANIINLIKSSFPNYIGHDTAKLDIPVDHSCVITKDILLENIHFRTSYVSPKSLAHRVLHANLSDLAASGAQPKFIMLGLSTSQSYESYIYDFINCFLEVCKKAQVYVIGGDTTLSQSNIFLSITAIGYTKKNHGKTRYGAKRNDLICVAGSIGEAHLGLLALENNIDGLYEFKEKFLFPKAKIKEGIWLGKHEAITSMIDISDGLFIDAKRLAVISEVSAKIHLDKLLLSDSFIKSCKYLKLDPITTLLTGGEDYSLLFTVQNEYFMEISNKFLNNFGYQFSCIGNIEDGKGINIMKHNSKINLNLKPFSHFGEKL